MVGGCCRRLRCFSVTLMFLLAVGFTAGSLRAQEPPPTDDAEDAAEESTAATDTASETGTEVESEAGCPERVVLCVERQLAASVGCLSPGR